MTAPQGDLPVIVTPTPGALVDRYGNTVEQVTYTIPARTVLVARRPGGSLLHGYGVPEPTSAADLTALGVDVPSLVEA